MLLTKCKNCDGIIILARYLGQDELKRFVAEMRCDKGHTYKTLIPSVGPTTIERTIKFPPGAGKWITSPEDPKNKAGIGCPGCGGLTNVAPPIHTIAEDGKVTPSWTCPYGCGWHAFISLADWPVPGEEDHDG